MFEQTGDRQLSAGRPGSSPAVMAGQKHGHGLFREGHSCTAMRYFMAGYRLES
ncbi:hypothetical protein DMH17_06055 [Raoultella planticola]|nr:hypothetical protein [Raoultella planticola]